MERQSKESRGLEAHCRGGQGPPRAVAPSGGGVALRGMISVRIVAIHGIIRELAVLWLL